MASASNTSCDLNSRATKASNQLFALHLFNPRTKLPPGLPATTPATPTTAQHRR